MAQTIQVLDKQIERIEYKGTPVVTFKQIDQVHERPHGTAKRVFYYHADRHIEGRDYFMLPYEEWCQIPSVRNLYPQNFHHPISFITESGYLKIAKSFTDDLAWKVHDILIESYFEVKQIALPAAPHASPELKDKYIVLLEENRELLKENRELLKAELLRLQPVPKPIRKPTTPLTNREVMEIYDLKAGGLKIKQIADEIGRSSAVVSMVLKFRPRLPLHEHTP